MEKPWSGCGACGDAGSPAAGEKHHSPGRLEGRLVNTAEAGPETRILTFSISATLEEPRPGQFFMIRSLDPAFPLFPRALAVLDYHVESGKTVISFLCRAVGRGTSVLNSSRPGSEAVLIGPAGNGFPDPPPGRELILVGGGTGVAAFYLLMKKRMEAAGGGAGVELLHGARDAASLFLRDRFGSLPFPVRVSTEDGSAGTRGMVDRLLLDRLAKKGGDEEVIFTCGPDPMMRVVAGIGRRFGVETFVSLETRMACGVGLCNGCAVTVEDRGRVEYQRACVEGPVFPAALLPEFRGDDGAETP